MARGHQIQRKAFFASPVALALTVSPGLCGSTGDAFIPPPPPASSSPKQKTAPPPPNKSEDAKGAEEMAAILLEHVKGGKIGIAAKIAAIALQVDSSLGAPAATAVANAISNAVSQSSSNAPATSPGTSGGSSNK